MSSVIELTRRHESTAVNTFGLGIDPPEVVRGRGACLWTADGRRLIDLVCGSATTNLGHGHPAHLDAIRAALEEGILHTGTRLPSRHRAQLYERLSAVLPQGLDSIHLMNSGSEAVETALKAARHATGRKGIVAFEGGYHGRTLGALAVTASRRIRAPFEPLPGPVTFAPYPYALRPPLPSATPDSIAQDCLDWLAHRLASPVSGADLPAAMIVEAVQGVSGVLVPPPAFLRGLRDLCDSYGILLVVDEIWNGFGRTGVMFAFEHAGVSPDLVVLGKALSGSLPLSAVAGRADLLKRWPPGIHTSTFQGNPLACAAAVATIDTIRKDRLIERCAEVIAPRLQNLSSLTVADGVAQVRVAGALAGLELVDAAGAPDGDRLARVQRRCLSHGVLVYGGGWYGNVLMLVPPLVIAPEELDEALALVRGALVCEPPTLPGPETEKAS